MHAHNQPAGHAQGAFSLSLADGSRFCIEAADADAAAIVGFWARVAGLPAIPAESSSQANGHAAPGGLAEARPRRLLARTVSGVLSKHDADAWKQTAGGEGIACPLEPRGVPRRLRKAFLGDGGRRGKIPAEPICLTEDEWSWQQLARLSACIGRDVQQRGGILLHSGLAEYAALAGFSAPADGRVSGIVGERFGFLLAGRSGVGKSTACRRLPPPWRPLADDITLVARDAVGGYWAHPFPTWSRFFGKETEGGADSWDVQYAVPLRSLLILEQGDEDHAEPLGRGHALSLLAVSARQASAHFTYGMPAEQIAGFHRERFDNLRALVNAVPAFRLHVSLKGAFWDRIDELRRA